MNIKGSEHMSSISSKYSALRGEREYFKLLAAKLAPYGYEAGPLIDGIWSGVAAMVANDGSRTNEEAFWARFAQVLGDAMACSPSDTYALAIGSHGMKRTAILMIPKQ